MSGDIIERETANTILMMKCIFPQSNKLKDYLNDICEIPLEGGSVNTSNTVKKSSANETFKKISLLFKAINQLLRILILRVDDERYQEILMNPIKTPYDVDLLALLIGTFSDAFNGELIDILYQIVSHENYADMYNISEINTILIPFVVDEKINEKKLNDDFSSFSLLVKELACSTLNINTYFEPNEIFEYDNDKQV